MTYSAPERMSAQLSLVAPQIETPGRRAQRLMAEAREAADEQIQALAASLQTVMELAAEIAVGGDAYPAGVREMARRMAEEVQGRSQTLEAILHHTGPKRG
jgi:hypothetical protein